MNWRAVAILCISALLAALAEPVFAQSQPGSAGGSIGKTNKSVSGDADADADAGAAAVPKQLLGKTITIQGTVTVTGRDDQGKTFTGDQPANRVIYVSKLGRVFSRIKLSGGSNNWSEEQTPGARAQERTYRVEGNAIRSRGTVNGIYKDIKISFDPSFRSCTIASTSKILGPQKTLDGKTVQVSSIKDNVSCSVQAGNTLAE
jgi:hypothetical protein